MPEPISSLELRVGSQMYAGWTRARVQLGVERLAGAYDLELSERWVGQDTPWQIQPGDIAQLFINGVPVITGPVDAVSPGYDARSHRVTVRGRDATGDLVDCSAAYSPAEYSGQTLESIVRRLAAPFGIAVIAEAAAARGTIARLAIEPGESVFSVIDRAARQVGVLPVSDGLGGLRLIEPSTARIGTALVLGQNILAASATHDHRDRYSHYTVLAQNTAEAELASDSSVPEILATARDAGVRRHRPLILLAEQSLDAARAATRAQWEARVHAAESLQVTYVVAGFSHADGLWQPDRLVSVQDDYLRIRGDLYLAEVAFILDEQGSRTELTCTRRDAFVRIPEPEATARGQEWAP